MFAILYLIFAKSNSVNIKIYKARNNITTMITTHTSNRLQGDQNNCTSAIQKKIYTPEFRGKSELEKPNAI